MPIDCGDIVKSCAVGGIVQNGNSANSFFTSDWR